MKTFYALLALAFSLGAMAAPIADPEPNPVAEAEPEAVAATPTGYGRFVNHETLA